MTDRDISERLADRVRLFELKPLSEIDVLTAEVARLTAERDALVATVHDELAENMRERAERAEAERDALRADAERMDSGVIALETWSAFEGERVTCVHSGVNLRAALTAALTAQQSGPCRHDGRCQYAIDHGAEGLGHCPRGKCAMAAPLPQRVPLTGWELSRVIAEAGGYEFNAVSGSAMLRLIRAIERAHGITLADTEGGDHA